MKMSGFILVLVLGLAVCGLLVHRHGRRVSGSPATIVAAPARFDTDDLRPVDAWQRGLKLSLPTDNSAASQALRGKLQREEEKQRPEEGRN
jgi:hypothetical protein